MNCIERYLRVNCISRKQFSQVLGITPSALWCIENGRVPRAQLVLKIHEVTKGEITPNMLYGVK